MRTVAIVNQKGGCGKTTTTVNLAGCLAADGQRVLVVDMDPQAHATLALGVDPESVEENVYEVLAEEDGAERLPQVVLSPHERIDLVPSGIVLSALEQRLAADRSDSRTQRLAQALARVGDDYDFALIDCPPNVGLLTFNALRAAREVIVPLETSHFAIHGVKKLLETITLLSERIGHDVHVRILPTLYDGRTRYARDTLAEIREGFGDLCFDTVIRMNVKLREAARRGKPILQIARSANGAADYGALAVQRRGAARGHGPGGGGLRARGGDPVPGQPGQRRADRRRLQRLDPGQGRALAAAVRGCEPGVDQDPAPLPRHLPVPLRGGRGVAAGSGEPEQRRGPRRQQELRPRGQLGPCRATWGTFSTTSSRRRSPRGAPRP